MKPFIIKCGGSVLENIPDSFYVDLIKIQKNGQYFPIIVHGGGPAITKLLSQLHIKSEFHNGLRVTSQEVLEVVKMVLMGQTNKMIVTKLIQAGGTAIGVSGIDGFLTKVEPLRDVKDIGFVGKVVAVNQTLLEQFIHRGWIPVISPIGMDDSGVHYNINADMVASAIAESFQAPLCYLSNVPGIHIEVKGEKTILHSITKNEAQNMIAEGLISGGMIPKIQAALDSLQRQVPEVVIVNGEEPHIITRYLHGDAVGTKILIGEEASSNV